MYEPWNDLMQSLTYRLWMLIYKLLNIFGKIPGVARLMSLPKVSSLREAVLARYVEGMPDRRYWESHIMPVLLNTGFKQILSVGCGSYTRHVHDVFESRSIMCWTSDIAQEAAIWGNPKRHITCDIAKITDHFPAGQFDAVLFNGVMGYGVTGAMMDTIAPVLYTILRPGGLLLIGWNRGLVEDPCTLKSVTDLFSHTAPAGLPARMTFASSTHVYDWFISRGSSQSSLPVS